MVLFFLIIIVFLISIYERRSRNWLVSPIILLSYPTTCLIIIHYFIAQLIGQRHISDSAMYITIGGFICFWIGTLLFRLRNQILYRTKDKILSLKVHKNFTKYFILVSSICILGMLADLRSILANRSSMIIEDKEFANNGLAAHLSNFITISIIFFIGSLKIPEFRVKRKIAITFLLCCLFLKFLTAIKGELILPIIGGIILLLYYKKIIMSFKTLFIVAIVSTFLFIGMGLTFNSGNKEFELLAITDFFSYYLFSGLTGLSGMLYDYHLVFGQYPLWIGRTFVNFYEKFLGSGTLDTASATTWVVVTLPDAFLPHASNVATLIGEIFMNCGFILGIFVLIVLGWYTAYLFKMAKRYYLYGIVYAYVGACLVLNFFSTYIIQPGFYETQLACFILVFITYYRRFYYASYISSNKSTSTVF